MNSLVVDRHDPTKFRIASTPLQSLNENQILLKIDKFGFTSNNITYIGLGNSFHYFDFFSFDATHSSVPVWGIATVVDSKSPKIVTGERIYGYFPMANYCVLEPIQIRLSHFYVSRPHLPADRQVYHQYFRAEHDPDFPKNDIDCSNMIIFRPLWGTAFFLQDFLEYNNYFETNQIIISSASSRTAYCFALLLKNSNIKVTGLTSSRNVSFVNSLNVYDHVVEYSDIETLDKLKLLYVDVAGDSSLDQQLYAHLGDFIIQRVSVGMSHFDSKSNANFAKDISEKSILFFAPDWIKKRFEMSSGKEALIKKRIVKWKELLEFAQNSTKLEILFGEDALKDVYLKMLHGTVDPSVGLILSYWPTKSQMLSTNSKL
jgi:hypothetical protein